MLKRDITFKDFHGDTVTETHYFNLTKTELVELELDYAGGLENNLTAMVEAKDGRTLMKEFKKIILMAYGKKSEDGRRFIKTQELRDEFVQTAAYDALFIELVTDEEAAAKFIEAVLPEMDETEKSALKQEMAEKLGTAERPKTTAELAAEQS